VGCGLCMNVCSKQIKLDLKKGFAVIEKQDKECLKKAALVCPQKAIKEINENLTIAIGTDDKKEIKQSDHIGMSKYFQIWKYSFEKNDLIFIETRENIKYKEDEERIHGDPGKAKAVSSVLDDVDVIVGRIMGPNIVRLRDRFVAAIVREPKIKKAIEIIKENINEIIEEKHGKERRGIILN
jgi:hypothetical protein